MKKITIITGHYGSGKTNLSVNLAMQLAKQQEKVTIVDFDIVNPYFRTADFQDLFEKMASHLQPLCMPTPVWIFQPFLLMLNEWHMNQAI